MVSAALLASPLARPPHRPVLSPMPSPLPSSTMRRPPRQRRPQSHGRQKLAEAEHVFWRPSNPPLVSPPPPSIAGRCPLVGSCGAKTRGWTMRLRLPWMPTLPLPLLSSGSLSEQPSQPPAWLVPWPFLSPGPWPSPLPCPWRQQDSCPGSRQQQAPENHHRSSPASSKESPLAPPGPESRHRRRHQQRRLLYRRRMSPSQSSCGIFSRRARMLDARA
mmetsp:Transcript_29759/g.98705  ORF Transcript_29759/g.98705 Transcript_29759/m.98705 type:complete len:218 (+) Transcript_29759:844-1497(+)